MTQFLGLSNSCCSAVTVYSQPKENAPENFFLLDGKSREFSAKETAGKQAMNTVQSVVENILFIKISCFH